MGSLRWYYPGSSATATSHLLGPPHDVRRSWWRGVGRESGDMEQHAVEERGRGLLARNGAQQAAEFLRGLGVESIEQHVHRRQRALGTR